MKNASVNESWWRKRMEQSGFRLTAPRELIIKILCQTNQHLSAEDIYIKALKKNPSIGLTTVYRTLELFTQIGLTQKFDFGDGKSRYELIQNPQREENHHHHLVCIQCKNIINYNDFVQEELELMQKTERALSRRHSFQIMHHIIHFYGLCKHCRTKT